MRRRAIALLVIAALSFPVMPTAALAKSSPLKVSAKAKVVKQRGAAKKVSIATKSSRKGSVTVKVYKGKKVIKTIKSKSKTKKKTIVWNLKDSKGRKVSNGKYSYKVTFTSKKRSVTKKGAVKVPSAPKVVRPNPAPPAGKPAVTPKTTPAPSPKPAPVPVVNPSPTPVANPSPVPTTDRWIGYYVPGAPSNMSALAQTESQTGVKAEVVHFFIADSEEFPAPRCEKIAAHGSIPLVTLEFWSTENGGLKSITDGKKKEAYLRRFARAAKAYDKTIWLRPFHEMNGNWYPWGPVNGNSSADLVAAWKYVKDIFTEEGATNVKFVWCVNNESVPNTSANAIAKYWPGDDYVDYLSIDGYNSGTSQSWSSWRMFAGVFGDSYKTVTSLSADPLFIGETSSVEQGGNKAAWVTDMFATIPTKLPRIVGVVWFDAKKTYDWRISSSNSSIQAFKTAAAAGF